jgi:uncharacterized BrkB/YihY/UPF0761 family membrane protein
MDLANDGGEIGMKRKWNWPIWVGLVVTVGGLLSYGFFAQFPITRDFPWANLLLLGVVVALLIFGLFRAFGRPQLYRGKIFGSILTAIALFLFAFFSCEIFTFCARFRSPLTRRALAKRRPNSHCSIKMESKSRWADLLSGSRVVVLIFYRGFW